MASHEDPPLTAKQIANWRAAIPELRFATDIQVQAYRDRLQDIANEGIGGLDERQYEDRIMPQER